MMPPTNRADAPLLQVCGVSVQYAVRKPLGRRGHSVPAVRDVSLELLAGRTLGIVGESGSGKSTLARCLAGLESPTLGEVRVNGSSFGQAQGRELAGMRRQVQLILQDSATSINPRFTASEVVAEPMVIEGHYGEKERRRQVAELLAAVKLDAGIAGRRPHQISGGQRQRLAIARALAVRPSVFVLDEAFAGLDLPVQQRICSLLAALQQQHGLSYVLISHDFGMVAEAADEIAVMHEGAVIERGTTSSVLRQPREAQTRRLVQAMPARTRRLAVASR